MNNILQKMMRDSTWQLIGGMLAAILIFGLIASEFNIGSFSSTVLNGMLRAMLLFLVAAGLSLIFGLMDILNFAQGGYFMVGAYVAYDFQHPDAGSLTIGEAIPDPTLRFFVAIIFALIVGGILGYILERFFLRPLYDRPLFQLVLTFGASLVFLEGVKFIWKTVPYTWREDTIFQANKFNLFGTTFELYRLFIIVMGLLLIVLISLLLRRTRIGIIIRAGVEDPEMVRALGINVRAVFTLVFTIGCAIAAFGGAVAAPFLQVHIGLGNLYLLGAIAVIVLGGLGSYEGTAIASIIVGLAWVAMDRFSVSYGIGAVWGDLTPMLMLAMVLLLRPKGLFGEER